MATNETKICSRQALLEGIDPDILEAAKEVDRSLSDWLLSLPPLERIRWSLARAAEIAGYRRE